jgi:hypothetical protein
MNAIPAAELEKRKPTRKKPAPRYTRGVLAKYAAHVTSTPLGAVTDADLNLEPKRLALRPSTYFATLTVVEE